MGDRSLSLLGVVGDGELAREGVLSFSRLAADGVGDVLRLWRRMSRYSLSPPGLDFWILCLLDGGLEDDSELVPMILGCGFLCLVVEVTSA